MKNRFLIAGLIASIFLACSEPKVAPEAVVEQSPEKEKVVEQGELAGDEQSVMFLHEVSIQQVQIGDLAKSNTTNRDVNNLGAKMEKVYSKVLHEVTMIAERRKIPLPPSLNEHGLSFFETMKKKKSADFDKTYCSIMVGDHLTAVDEMEHLAKTSKDEKTQEIAKELTIELKLLSAIATECKSKIVQ
jgi:predicted outer membrane protein